MSEDNPFGMSDEEFEKRVNEISDLAKKMTRGEVAIKYHGLSKAIKAYYVKIDRVVNLVHDEKEKAHILGLKTKVEEEFEGLAYNIKDETKKEDSLFEPLTRSDNDVSDNFKLLLEDLFDKILDTNKYILEKHSFQHPNLPNLTDDLRKHVFGMLKDLITEPTKDNKISLN